MLPIFLTILTVVALVFSISINIKKRRKAKVTGIKTALTSICFYLIAVIQLLGYWLDFLGTISWTMTLLLLIAGAYFTKYLPVKEDGDIQL
ncbi:hypothetical protein [Sediminibacillus halophilus]|uniref:Uncharacterized protein n=1 Tax=Sediminibacillus halophilus TaxID=482461 RepID=A0A1G9NMP8_9BACI|nr:hypothetical protein [Sediminibacillus halophilus]SDL87858.1 hypothetical protein SAMN05216244_1076 [Sediminibacillus halophilus]